jgi:hypothetical protein
MRFLLFCLMPMSVWAQFSNRFAAPSFDEIAISRLPKTGVYHATFRQNLVQHQTIELSIDAYDAGDAQHIMLQLVRGTSTIIGQFFLDDVLLPNLKNIALADLNQDGRTDFKLATRLSGKNYMVHYFYQQSDGTFKGMGFESICLTDSCALESDINQDGYFDILQISEQMVKGQPALLYNPFKPEQQQMRSLAVALGYPKAFQNQREISLTAAQQQAFMVLTPPNFKIFEAQQTRFRLASRCKNAAYTKK